MEILEGIREIKRGEHGRVIPDLNKLIHGVYVAPTYENLVSRARREGYYKLWAE
jgi:hypothetical protein